MFTYTNVIFILSNKNKLFLTTKIVKFEYLIIYRNNICIYIYIYSMFKCVCIFL